MSHITDEVIRVLSNQNPRRALTASEIYAAGEFEDIQPVYVAISTMAGKPDGRLLRSTPANGGKYAYEVNPHPRKNGAAIEIPGFVAARGPVTAKNVVAAQTQPVIPVGVELKSNTSSSAPAAAPAKTPEAKQPAVEPPPAAITELAISQPSIVAFENSNPDDDPVELELDCLFAAMVLRLPDKSTRWTKAQRASWLTMFNAAADFLYPESR